MRDSRKSQDFERRLEALRQLIAWARGDHICKRCNGTGELGVYPLDYFACPDCDGQGEVEVA